MKPRAKKTGKKESTPKEFPIPGVDAAQLERLLEFMDKHGLEEFEYEHGGLHIRLRKASAAPSAPAAPSRRAETDGSAGDPGAAAASPAEELHIIKSPMVGTFYAAAGPEAEPFVKVGDLIHERQVVCIIEAMKLMNEIEADGGGEVTSVLVKNGQPVEYGQPLFAVRPAGKKK